MASAGLLVAESIVNIRTIRSLPGASEVLVRKYEKLCETVLEKEKKRAWLNGITMSMTAGLAFCCYILGFVLGAKMLRDGSVTFHDMFRAIMCIMLGGTGAAQTGSWLPDILRAKASAYDVWQIVDRKSLIDGQVAETEEEEADHQAMKADHQAMKADHRAMKALAKRRKIYRREQKKRENLRKKAKAK